MKKLIFGISLTVILALAIVFTGCSHLDLSSNEGPITTQDYNFTDFTGIEMGHAFELQVIPSSTYKISITASENVLKRTHVSKSGDILKIDMESWTFTWRSSPKVTVTMPVLTALNLSGASHGSAIGFKSDEDFNLKLSGASQLDLDMEAGNFKFDISGASSVTGRLTATSSDIDLSGASHIELSGSGGNIKLHASGASHADMAYYTVNDADTQFTGASHGILDISGRLDVTLSGASSLEYQGNPTHGKG